MKENDTGSIYKLTLNDCATPSFYSFSKPFFGTSKEFESFVIAYKNDKDRDATHIVASSKLPLLVPAHLVYSARHTLKYHQWNHINIWDCIYHMRCSQADTEHRWIECEGEYYRCMTATFENLEMENNNDIWHSIKYSWGLPHVLCFEQNRVYNRPEIHEKSFQTKQEMDQDYQEFLKSPAPILVEFCNEIFGDG